MSPRRQSPKVPKRVTVSPLRYPGGKGLLYSRLRSIIRENALTSSTYVEPYAGGAGAALGLLISGQVERIAINDLDPCVYSFWRAVVDHPEDFTRLINTVELSVREWDNQREILKSSDSADILSRGFATFYLNRTNRSGVLNGGPIGGRKQDGDYKIDARFNRDALAERVRLIALYADRISVTNLDGRAVIKQHANDSSSFIYADPPYFEKAGSLYLNSFTPEDHEELAVCLNSVEGAPWVLTYDNVPRVADLYADRRQRLFSLNYSAHRVVKAEEIMVLSDRLVIPAEIEAASRELERARSGAPASTANAR